MNKAAGVSAISFCDDGGGHDPVPTDSGVVVVFTSDAGATGNFSYLFKITYGYRDANGLVLWESPAIVTNQDGFFLPLRVNLGKEISSWGGVLSGDVLDFRVDLAQCATGTDNINFIRLWRTLDIYDVTQMNDTALLSAQSYRLEAEDTITPTGVWSLNRTTHVFQSDETIVASAPILTITDAHSPIPTGGPLTYYNGFLFSADKEVVYYSTGGDAPSQVGYYFAGGPCQLRDKSTITAIAPVGSYVLVSTIGSLRRLSTENTLDVALAPGLYEPLIKFAPYISESIGVPSQYAEAVTTIDNRIIMLCSDNHLRSYTGEALEVALDLNRCEKILREIAGNAVAVYSPEGYYALWWSDSLTSTEYGEGLRFDIIPGGGLAAARIVYGTDVLLKPCAISKAMSLRMGDGATESWTGILCYIYNPTVIAQYSVVGDFGWNVYTQSYTQSSNADLPWSVTFGQYKGEYDGFILTHTESILTTQGSFGLGTFELLTDGAANESFGQRIAHTESIKLSGQQINANISLTRSINNLRYVQIRLSGTESSGFELCRVQSAMIAADRAYRNGSPVLDFADSTPKLCYQNAMSGYLSQNLRGDVREMDARLSTFQADAPIICTDGVRRTIETLTTVAGSCAVVQMANLAHPSDNTTIFAGLWLKTNNSLPSTASNIISFGNAYTLRMQSRYADPVLYWDLSLYSPNGLVETKSIVAPIGEYVHIHFAITQFATTSDDLVDVAVNTVQSTFYPAFKTTLLEDFVVGGGFCVKDSDGVCNPRATTPVTIHDLRCGVETGVVLSDDYYNDYISNQGAFITPATNIYP